MEKTRHESQGMTASDVDVIWLRNSLINYRPGQGTGVQDPHFLEVVKRHVPVQGDKVCLVSNIDDPKWGRFVPYTLCRRHYWSDKKYKVKTFIQSQPCDNIRIEGTLLLHFVCREPLPLNVLKYIATSDPSALQTTCSVSAPSSHSLVSGLMFSRALPLHVAIEMFRFDPKKTMIFPAFKYLVEQFPQALAIRNCKGSLPLEQACNIGATPPSLLRYLDKHHSTSSDAPELKQDPFWLACKAGHPLPNLLTLLCRDVPLAAIRRWHLATQDREESRAKNRVRGLVHKAERLMQNLHDKEL
ncbi:expressed unknown protein (Partial), partial [Seminavis robusta]|eukprot:Sro457_g146770.1 n/a (299) ;mRNA; r:2-898